jgi:hypothetical protein
MGIFEFVSTDGLMEYQKYGDDLYRRVHILRMIRKWLDAHDVDVLCLKRRILLHCSWL